MQGEGEDGARSAATYNVKRNICEHIGTWKHIRNTLEAFKRLKQLACLLYFRTFDRRSLLQFYRDFPSNLVPLLSNNIVIRTLPCSEGQINAVYTCYCTRNVCILFILTPTALPFIWSRDQQSVSPFKFSRQKRPSI